MEYTNVYERLFSTAMKYIHNAEGCFAYGAFHLAAQYNSGALGIFNFLVLEPGVSEEIKDYIFEIHDELRNSIMEFNADFLNRTISPKMSGRRAKKEIPENLSDIDVGMREAAREAIEEGLV